MKRLRLSYLLMTLFIATLSIGCSKSGGSSEVPHIDEIPGTYTGDLLIVNGESSDWINDAVFIVTKAGGDKIHIKPASGKAYSDLKEHTYTVQYTEESHAIITKLGDLSNGFSYDINTGILGFNPYPYDNQTNFYVFEGTK